MGKRSKKPYVILGIAVLAIALACGAKWWAAAHPAETAAGQPAGQADERGSDAQGGAPADASPDGGAQSAQAGDEGGLTEREREALAAYGDTEREVQAILSANVWGSEGSSAILRFADASYAETKEGSPDVERTFVMTAAKLETDASETSSEYTTRYIVAADVGGEGHILTLSRFHPASGAVQPWRIEGACFEYSAAYVRVDAATELSVSGVDGRVAELIGGQENADKLASMIAEYASQFYPTASSAVLMATVTLDCEQQTAVLQFQLNNQSKTVLKVLHPLGTDGFEIGR